MLNIKESLKKGQGIRTVKVETAPDAKFHKVNIIRFDGVKQVVTLDYKQTIG